MKTLCFEFGKWAIWSGTNDKILLSDEKVKQLRSFDSTDNCINWLFVNGAADAARALHKHIKDSK